MPDGTTVLTRQQLFDLVWSKAVVRVAAEFGVSGTAVRKACKHLRVPTPENGHWSKLRHGRKVVVPKLPASAEGEPVATSFSAWASKLNESSPVKPASPSEPLPVPRPVHPAVKKTTLAFRGGGVDSQTGVLQTKADMPHLPLFVTRGTLDRSFEILNELLWKLEKIGFRVETGEKPKDAFRVVHGETNAAVGWSLREVIERREREREADEVGNDWIWDRWRYSATGRLRIALSEFEPQGARKSWADGNIQKLDEELDSVVEGFLVCARAIHARKIEWEERQKQWAIEARVREEQERRKRAEDQRREALRGAAARWHAAESLSQFVAACESALRNVGQDELPEGAKTWLDWANRVAKEIDPLKGDYLTNAIRELAGTQAPGRSGDSRSHGAATDSGGSLPRT